jgi:hypothetical protein
MKDNHRQILQHLRLAGMLHRVAAFHFEQAVMIAQMNGITLDDLLNITQNEVVIRGSFAAMEIELKEAFEHTG